TERAAKIALKDVPVSAAERLYHHDGMNFPDGVTRLFDLVRVFPVQEDPCTDPDSRFRGGELSEFRPVHIGNRSDFSYSTQVTVTSRTISAQFTTAGDLSFAGPLSVHFGRGVLCQMALIGMCLGCAYERTSDRRHFQ